MTKTIFQPPLRSESCTKSTMAIKDALEVLNGRFTLAVIHSVIHGPKRFKEISREIQGITDKALSKELKELEMNQVISRTVHATFPPRVEYMITPHGRSLETIVIELEKWGLKHRKKIMGK